MMNLELNVKQNQALSQRMLQSVRILQMTSQELESYVDELALENPALDVEHAASESIDAYQQDYAVREQDRYLAQRQNNDDDTPGENWNFSTGQDETLQEHLLSQLDLRYFTRRDALILAFLIESLDGRGYLTEDAGFVAERFQAGTEDVERLIHLLQSLEPAGVCARSLEECLRLQLAAVGLLDDTLDRMIGECLELVAKSKYAAIAARLGITSSAAARYSALLRTLEPKPGSRFFHRDDARYIVPDVYVLRADGRFVISLSGTDSPTVTVNHYYQKLCDSTGDPETHTYLQEKIRQVQWLRQCIDQRQTTLRKVAEEIFKRQAAFFAKGPAHLLPMKMSEVAAAIDMHESTVSRAIDKKYLQCDYGVFPMSAFFQRRATARDRRSVAIDDQSFTSDAVKRMLKEIIRTEPPRKPFSDRVLCEKLLERGVTISRRTVSKYREEAGIPDASGRKSRCDEHK